MDINQIFIKNNQTNKLNDSPAKGMTQGKASDGTSFQQILAKFQLVGQNQAVVTQKPAEPEPENTPLMESVGLTEEDWKELDDLLAALLAAMTQVQMPAVTQQENETTDSEPQQLIQNITSPSESMNMANAATDLQPQMEVLPESILEELKPFLQKLDGQNILEETDQSQLVKRFEQIMAKLLDEPAQFNIPAETAEKLQQLISIKVKPVAIPEPLNSLSLDKTQLGVPFVLNEQSSDSAEQPQAAKSDETPLLAAQTVQGAGDGKTFTQAAPASSPLPVSKFVPEVSEWMERFMKVTGGQNGSTEAVLSLSPERLGDIKIKISSEKGQVSVQILTDSPLAKNALETQLQQLRQSLQQQGLQVQKLDIVQNTQPISQENQWFSSFSQGSFNSGQGHRQNRTDADGAKKQKQFIETDIDGDSMAVTYGRTAPRAASRIDFTA